jgi:hypothetical protein
LLGLDNSKIKFLTVIDKSGKMIYGDWLKQIKQNQKGS